MKFRNLFHFFHYFYQWLSNRLFCQFWPLCHTPMVNPSSPPGFAVFFMPVDSNWQKMQFGMAIYSEFLIINVLGSKTHFSIIWGCSYPRISGRLKIVGIWEWFGRFLPLLLTPDHVITFAKDDQLSGTLIWYNPLHYHLKI